MRRLVLIAMMAVSLHAASYDLLVQGALDVELGPLLAALQNKKEVRVETWTFWTGKIGKQNVVISRTDVGSINAVASTVLGIQKFRPKRIINQGTAGGHSRRVNLWDIVIGEKTTDYAAFKTDHANEGAGVHPEKWQPRGHAFRFDPAKPTDHLNFAGDTYLMEKAEKVVYSRGKVYRGNVGTAFQYNRELDYLTAMNKIFGTDSEDMESAYAAGAAAAHKVPFLAIRIISDTEWEHPQFEKIAGQYCAEFVRDLILALP